MQAQLFSANATALLQETPIFDESQALVEQIEGHVEANAQKIQVTYSITANILFDC